MVFPVIAFLGGAVVGAAAALLLKERLDRGTAEERPDSGAGAVDTSEEKATDRVSKKAPPAAETSDTTADEAKPAPRRSRAPRTRKARDSGAPAS